MRVKPILTLLAAAAGAIIAVVYATRRSKGRSRLLTQSELIFIYGEKAEQLDTDDLTRIVIAEGKAYWIEEGIILVAPADENDEIDFDSAEVYNAIEAPRSELTKIMLILDNLKEDT